MTDKEIQDLPIEEIIKLPELYSITKEGGFDDFYNGGYDISNMTPTHWKICFKASKHPKGYYLWGDLKIPHPHYVIYKIIQ